MSEKKKKRKEKFLEEREKKKKEMFNEVCVAFKDLNIILRTTIISPNWVMNG